MLGSISIRLQAAIETAKNIIAATTHYNEQSFNSQATERLLCTPSFYHDLSIFQGDIAPNILATATKNALQHMTSDWEKNGLKHMYEWRCSTSSNEDRASYNTLTHDNVFEIINDTNAYQPELLESNQYNSNKMVQHLQQILKLCSNNTNSPTHNPTGMSDSDILQEISQSQLPLFIGVDGGFDNGLATVSVVIAKPDTRATDQANEWEDRLAKPLLIRFMQLPAFLGASPITINMAETLGLIIADYSIPHKHPTIIITDSQNARTLQRNLFFQDNFTHRQLTRKLRFGISHSLSAHLNMLTTMRLPIEDLPPELELIQQAGIQLLKKWANTTTPTSKQDNSQQHEHESYDDEQSSLSTTGTTHSTSQNTDAHRFTFNPTMYDILSIIILLKVFSHQLSDTFQPVNTKYEKNPAYL